MPTTWARGPAVAAALCAGAPAYAEEAAWSIDARLRTTAESEGETGGAMVLPRVRFTIDTQPSDRARLRLVIASHLGRGYRDPLPPEENRLDVAEAWVGLEGEGAWRLRLGRQEWNYGIGRIIAVRDLPNVRRAFDGVLLRLLPGDWQIDLLAASPVDHRPGILDDRPAPDERLIGVYAARRSVDVYWLYRKAPDVAYATGRGFERRHSLGVRHARTEGALRWDWEAVVQWGDLAGIPIRAWTLATEQSWGQEAWPAALRLGLRANVASGDGSPKDGQLGTFNALYPRLSYFSEAAIVTPANVVDLQPFLEMRPSDRLTVRVATDILWRHRRADAVYLAPFQPLALLPRSHFTGTSAELLADWRAAPGLTWRASITGFAPGSAARAAGLRAQTLFAVQTVVRFPP